MTEKLLNLMPNDLTVPFWAMFAAIGVGFVLWAIGAKISRSLFTLVFVAIGCLVGRRLPALFHWQIDGMATAVGAAVVMGVLGYSMHRIWVAILLGLTLATWGALAVWIIRAPSDPFPWPDIPDPFTPIDYAKSIWASLPGDVAHILPVVCGVLYASGFAMALLWHRLGRALLHSLLGATLLLSGLLLLVQSRYPQLMSRIPPRPWEQSAILGGVVLIGMGLQWMITWRKTAAPAPTIEPVPAPPAED
jgi:hypothetical protein